jgi:hypothetical protein
MLDFPQAAHLIAVQAFDSKQLLDDLLRDPENFVKHLQRYTTSVASTVLYGMRTSTAENGYIKDLMDVGILRHFIWKRLANMKILSGWKKQEQRKTSNSLTSIHFSDLYTGLYQQV